MIHMNSHSYVKPFTCKAVLILNTVIIINCIIKIPYYHITVLPYYALWLLRVLSYYVYYECYCVLTLYI